MKNKRYANAVEVLPLELVEQIKEHFSGTMLYIPRERISNCQTPNLIISLAKSGASTAEIARIAGVTTRRVNQVISKKRRKTWEWIE